MRVLCYAQHLSGVGHFVRMAAIARGLAATHAVHLVDGGRPVPGALAGAGVARVSLPIVFRSDGALAAADGSPIAAVLAERARLLAAVVADVRPDVVLVDHYPFSKWELAGEIEAAITAARRANPRARVLCSLRDIAPRTLQENLADGRYEAHVLELLHEQFDAVLVHADPAFARLEEHFGRAADLPVPIYYTGFVGSEPPAAGSSEALAVLSCGGGTRSRAFLLAAIAAFRRTSAAGLTAHMRLKVHLGAFAGAHERDALRGALADVRNDTVELAEFSADFATTLGASTLSISRAGYNTTVQLLQSRVPAVVVPDEGMSDQGPRARRLAALGLAEIVTGDPPDAAALAAAIARALAAPRRAHALRLDGVVGTREQLERLHAADRGVRG